MRNSERNIVFAVLATVVVGLLSLFLFQSVWQKAILSMMRSGMDSSAVPVATVAVEGISIPTAPAPVPIGVESTYTNVAITVTRVLSPADFYVSKYALYSVLENDEEYLLVDINVRCLPAATEVCRLTEFDFGVKSNSGNDYPSELSGSFDLKDSFEGGEIEPGESMKGAVIFAIKRRESGLTMYYPRMFGFGGEARFVLTN